MLGRYLPINQFIKHQPTIPGLQAILFYLPSLIWRILNWQSGVAVKGIYLPIKPFYYHYPPNCLSPCLYNNGLVSGIIQMCEDVGNMQIDKRKSSVEVVASHLSDSLKIQQNLGRKSKSSEFFVLLRSSHLITLIP